LNEVKAKAAAPKRSVGGANIQLRQELRPGKPELILDLANVWKFATLMKIKKASDENLQDAAAGHGHFNDGQLCFRPDLDADQRAEQ
jgi:hypothetical protein